MDSFAPASVFIITLSLVIDTVPLFTVKLPVELTVNALSVKLKEVLAPTVALSLPVVCLTTPNQIASGVTFAFTQSVADVS